MRQKTCAAAGALESTKVVESPSATTVWTSVQRRKSVLRCTKYSPSGTERQVSCHSPPGVREIASSSDWLRMRWLNASASSNAALAASQRGARFLRNLDIFDRSLLNLEDAAPPCPLKRGYPRKVTRYVRLVFECLEEELDLLLDLALVGHRLHHPPAKNRPVALAQPVDSHLHSPLAHR